MACSGGAGAVHDRQCQHPGEGGQEAAAEAWHQLNPTSSLSTHSQL